MLAGMEEVGTGLLDRLDAMQRVAASAPGGPLLIVAGPGTGKTRTLTHRIAYLCAELGVFPERCLAITFTRRAAEELRDRLDALLGDGGRGHHRRHVPLAGPDHPAGEREGRRAAARTGGSPTTPSAPQAREQAGDDDHGVREAAAPAGPGRPGRADHPAGRSCCATSRRWSRSTASAGSGSSWTSTRTSTSTSTSCCACSAPRTATCARSATRTRRSTRSAAPTWSTSCASPRTSPTPGWSG